MSVTRRILWAIGIGIGIFVLFTAATSAAYTTGPVAAIATLIGGMLLYWTWTERKDTDSAAETAQRVGEKASGFFGGVVDWFSAAVLSVGFVLLTIGGQLFDLVDVLVQMVSTAPVVSGTLGIGGLLAILDWNGTVGLQAAEWAVIITALIVIGVLGRRWLYGKVQT